MFATVRALALECTSFLPPNGFSFEYIDVSELHKLVEFRVQDYPMKFSVMPFEFPSSGLL